MKIRPYSDEASKVDESIVCFPLIWHSVAKSQLERVLLNMIDVVVLVLRPESIECAST